MIKSRRCIPHTKIKSQMRMVSWLRKLRSYIRETNSLPKFQEWSPCLEQIFTCPHHVHRYVFVKIMQHHGSGWSNSHSQPFIYSYFLAGGGQVMYFWPIRHKFVFSLWFLEKQTLPPNRFCFFLLPSFFSWKMGVIPGVAATILQTWGKGQKNHKLQTRASKLLPWDFLLYKENNPLLFKSLKSVCQILTAKIFLTDKTDKWDSFVAIHKILEVIESGTGLCLSLFHSEFSVSNFGEDEEDTVLLPRGSLQLNRA